ncbi:unnamed protein product [Adineta steineri]|uniref:Uncharacterized protein n=1 Tax=Adineta steineri TaxID=433720 RepID=A0A818VUN4_9BILA|nr:unnamed protein product [Adineta steineri]CAF3716285.1 unnamed protein product [Adineta steineri]
MRVSGRILVLSAVIITVISALFCIIGLSTKGWLGGTTGLFYDGAYKPPAALSVISFILLIVSIIALALQIFDILNGTLRYIPILILFVATFFLLASFSSAAERAFGYSYKLMVVAHFFSYVALAITAYWLGQSDVTTN